MLQNQPWNKFRSFNELCHMTIYQRAEVFLQSQSSLKKTQIHKVSYDPQPNVRKNQRFTFSPAYDPDFVTSTPARVTDPVVPPGSSGNFYHASHRDYHRGSFFFLQNRLSEVSTFR